MIIDFHSHMLPGIDDGSPDIDTSLKMLGMASQQGVEVQVMTPHYYPWREDVDSFLNRREDSADRLWAAMTDGLPQWVCGAEVAFFSHMADIDLDPLCIEGSRCLLVEMPFESWSRHVAEEIATLSLDRGYHIVLAHIERFLPYKGNPEILQELLKLPLHMQINAEAMLHFGTRRKVMQLADSHILILGSDAHNLSSRKPNLADGRRQIEKRLGAQYLHQMDQAVTTLLTQQAVYEGVGKE